jgi:hypothetical protein
MYVASNGYVFDYRWHHVCSGPFGTEEFTASDAARGFRLCTRGLYPSWQEYVARLLEFRRTRGTP